MSSNNSNSVTFYSDELAQAFEESRDSLTGYLSTLDRVSADIKTLEKSIRETKIETNFRYSLGETFEAAESNSQVLAYQIDGSGCADGWITRSFLSWGKDSSGTFRILHETDRYEGTFDIDAPGGPHFPADDPISSDSRPLIETKLETRLQVYRRLPEFVKALARSVEVPGGEVAQKLATSQSEEVSF